LDENVKSTGEKLPEAYSRNNWAVILFVSLVVTFTFVTIPRYPYLIDDALSEKAVLSYAHQHGFQFGKDIVFTYGPLGFLVSRYFFSHAAGIRMATDFLTCFATALGVSLVAWRLHAVWKWLLLGLFVFLAANIDPRADLVLYIGLVSWALLCFLESGSLLLLCASSFVLLAVFSVLVKANFLVLVGLSSTLLVIDLSLRGKLRTAILLAVCLPLTFLAGWMAAGQSLWNLKSFFVNSVPIILGYDQTVGIEGLRLLQQGGWITLPLIFSAAAIRTLTTFDGSEKRAHLRRCVLFGWMAVLIFIVWKHGFVRAGLFHGGFYFGLVPILALALEALPCKRSASNCSRILGLVCCLICLITLESLFFLNLKVSLLQPFRAIPENLRSLVKSGHYKQQMLQLQQTQLAGTELPRIRQIVGHSPVDVFGQDQSYAVFNDLNYRPRPIFQSYMAYNTPLVRLNEQFYFSKAAPEYVLFRLTPVDRRYAPLEDAAVLRDLLINYEPIEGENQFLLLKLKGNSGQSVPKLTLLREGTVYPSEPISLNEFGDADLWVQIDVKPTILGRARQFLYKPPIVRLAMWHKSSKEGASWFRAPVPMLAAGFVANPMLANNEDALNLYTGSAITRPYACSVEVGADNQSFWQAIIGYRIYKIENRLGRCAQRNLPRLLTCAGFETAPTEIVAASNAFVRIENKTAFFLPVGGFMRLDAPKGATTLEGEYGLARSAPNVQSADFRIEEQMPDGSMRLLQSHLARPGDYGLQPFSVLLSGETEHKLVLRTAVSPNAESDAARGGNAGEKTRLCCWTDVRFK
jgi:hypothetical protein